jgi:hypothetical protein
MEENIYDNEYLEEMTQRDQIDTRELGLMYWYDQDLKKDSPI